MIPRKLAPRINTPLQDGLVLYVDFRSGVASDVVYGNGGSIAGGSVSPKSVGTVWNGSGSSQYISHAIQNLEPKGSSSFTKAVLINAAQTAKMDIFGWGQAATKNDNVLRVNDTGNGFNNYFYSDDMAWTSSKYKAGKWNVVVITYDQTSQTEKGYVNGYLETTFSAGTINVIATPVQVGGLIFSSDVAFSGSIGAYAIWTRALTATEVSILSDNWLSVQ